MHLRKENEEVLFAAEHIVKVARADIRSFIALAQRNARQRIRLCAHRDINDKLHEMFIVHKRGVYVRPHKHLNKTEAFCVIEGSAEVILFGESGRICEVIKMGNYSSGRIFYYRISKPIYHSLLVRSKFLVFHEVTSGPFRKSDTAFAPWAPAENEQMAVKKFMKELRRDTKYPLTVQ